MFGSCPHDWDVTVKTVAKPVSLPSPDDFYDVTQEERFVFGLTTVLMFCKKGCGAYRVVEMLGVPKE